MYLLKKLVSLRVSFETCGAYEGKVESVNAKCIRKLLFFGFIVFVFNI